MDGYINERLQPILDYYDSSKHTRRLSLSRKDELFSDSMRKLSDAGSLADASGFLAKEIQGYSHAGFSRHLDQTRMLYLDLNSGHPQLAVNENYFRVEPPPHLQEFWSGNVFGDSTVYNVSLWDANTATSRQERLTGYTDQPNISLDGDCLLSFRLGQAKINTRRFILSTMVNLRCVFNLRIQ